MTYFSSSLFFPGLLVAYQALNYKVVVSPACAFPAPMWICIPHSYTRPSLAAFPHPCQAVLL